MELLRGTRERELSALFHMLKSISVLEAWRVMPKKIRNFPETVWGTTDL